MKKLSMFIPIFLTIVLAFSTIPNVYAQSPQFNLLPEEIYTNVSSYFDVVVEIEIKDPDRPMVGFTFEILFDPDSMEYATHTINNASTGWNMNVDLRDVGIGSIDIFTEEGVNDPPIPITRNWVTITFHCLELGDSLITIDGSIIFQDDGEIFPWEDSDSADVHQGGPVGGVFYSVDKIGLLSPWIAAISIIGCIAITSIIIKKRRA
jgi:hypothetical protein